MIPKADAILDQLKGKQHFVNRCNDRRKLIELLYSLK